MIVIHRRDLPALSALPMAVLWLGVDIIGSERMAALTMGFHLPVGASVILLRRDCFKMGWIHTACISAEMIKMKTLRNWPIRPLESKAMGLNRSLLRSMAPQTEASIFVLAGTSERRHPNVATRYRINHIFGVEPFVSRHHDGP
jgi:hypothetical protein